MPQLRRNFLVAWSHTQEVAAKISCKKFQKLQLQEHLFFSLSYENVFPIDFHQFKFKLLSYANEWEEFNNYHIHGILWLQFNFYENGIVLSIVLQLFFAINFFFHSFTNRHLKFNDDEANHFDHINTFSLPSSLQKKDILPKKFLSSHQRV